MKLSFKYVILVFILCLTIVFGWQLFWLKGLYDSIAEETHRDVIKCIENADQLELLVRSDKDEKEEKKNQQTISYSGEFEDNKVIFKKEETIILDKEGVKDTTFQSTIYDPEESLQFIETLIQSITRSMHDVIDLKHPINITLLDSLLKVDLKNKNIKAQHYYTELVDENENQVLLTSKVDSIQYPNAQCFSIEINPDKHQSYKVYMEPITKTVLIRMSGILVSTLLIIIILALAFYYLIRTIFKQKSLEEMKDDFTNNMTHELKTPIAVAYSAADALLNFNQDENIERRAKYLTICKEQLLKLSGLVEQILSSSMEHRKSFVLNKEDIHILELVNNLIEQHKLKADKEVSFSTHIPENLIIHADRTHLSNMISNLIDNAIKYSKEKAEITIEAIDKGDTTQISVKDNGMGIASDKQKNIFDKFYRVHSGNLHDVKGYGLGLFYLKTMAEKHGGTINVKSTLGKGSIFTIQLPKRP